MAPDQQRKPGDIDLAFVAAPAPGLVPVAVGGELVLLDGWTAATCLSAGGALIWSSLDGHSSLGEIAADLAAVSTVEEPQIAADLVRFVAQLAQRGLLENAIATEVEAPDIHLEVVSPHEVGDTVDGIKLRHLDGRISSVRDGLGSSSTLLINWNPHCGYCARISLDIAEVLPTLEARGCKLVLVASGGAEANRPVADAIGIDAAAVALLEPGQDVFRNAGTPAAYLLDATGRIEVPPAYGAEEVSALALRAAGQSASATVTAEPVRYLLDRDGACAPTSDPDQTTTWADTRVYRINGHHVGIRYNSAATAEILDSLLLGRVVDDRRAGHSFSIALNDPSTGSDASRGMRGLNLLAQPGEPPVRSRDPVRVLRALLSHMADGTVDFDPDCGRLQVDAIAIIHERGAALLPRELRGFEPRLQGLLARCGIALADIRHPEIDAETMELVVPEPAVEFDQSVLGQFGCPTRSASERPLVGPGRYPLTTWGVVQPGQPGATPLTPAEAAAATLSTVLHTVDAAERVRQLGRLFHSADGVGLWYDSESGLVEAIVAALGQG